MTSLLMRLSQPIKATILLLALPLFLAACGSSKSAVETPVKPGKMSPKDYLAQQIHYNTFSAKAQMHYEGEGASQDFTANIRMHKDKDIWASITALGGLIEAARAYIVPEKLQALNRLGREYYDMGYQEGLNLIQAQVSFADLQNLFTGNPLMADAPVSSSSETDTTIMIVMKKDDVTAALLYSKTTGLLQSTELSAPQRQFHCRIEYSAYGATTGKQPFSYKRQLQITNAGKTVRLDMNFNKAELNVPVDVSFSVPSSYKKGAIPK